MNGQSSERTYKTTKSFWIGVILLPVVFSWFTLRKKHSNVVRFISLGWMLCTIVLIIFIALFRHSAIHRSEELIEHDHSKCEKAHTIEFDD